MVEATDDSIETMMFLDDNNSSSQIMSMQDRQSQLVLRRRQQINRQQQVLQLNNDDSNLQHHQTTHSREGLRTACLDYRDSSTAHSISSFIGDVNVGLGGRPLLDDAASSYHRRIDIQRTAVGNNNRPISAPINNLQRGIRVGNNMMQHHSPSELTCTSTAIKQYASHVNHDNDARVDNDAAAVVAVVDDDDVGGETDADYEETVSSKDTLYLLERELDRKKKELEEARAKLEERGEDADRLRAELERMQRNEKDSQQPDRQQQQKQQQQQQSSPTAVNNGQDSSKPTCLQTERQDGSGRVTTSSHHSSGSDSGYQRYLNAYHRQPNKPSLSKQQSDATTSSTDISDITESCQGSTRRLSSTSLSRPISRARHSREAAPANPTSSTPAVERQPLKDGNNSQESQHKSRSLPLLQQQLSSSIDSANLDDPVVMRSILMNPCPKGVGMVQCYIRRNKGMKSTLGLFPEYRCYLRGNNNSRTETFLMTSKKRTGNKTSNYLISMGRNDHDKDSNNILGKLRGNFQSTEYIIYDHGKNPNSSVVDDNDEHHGGEGNNARIELGSVVYAPHSSLGKGGPRSITVGISNVDEEGDQVKVWQPLHNNNDSMLDCLKQKMEEEVPKSMDERLLRLESKQPAWDETMQRFFLNFNGRVTMASVKNYQLEDANGDVCLQFGRTGKDEFILDVQWPLSPFQAFALALSSFDSKVGCD